MIDLFMNENHVRIIQSLRQNKCNLLRHSKISGVTYGHLNKITKHMADVGLLNIDIDPENTRSKRVELTKKGEVIHDKIMELKELMK